MKRNGFSDLPGAVVKRLLPTALVLAPAIGYAACQSEMRMLGDDLAGVKLTSYQSQSIADKILQARRHCWVKHEKEAMDLINSARRIAGLKESSGDFDWENVPLESLEVEN
jgi:hypothetical protein